MEMHELEHKKKSSLVDLRRVRLLNPDVKTRVSVGPVVYWMQRDQRVQDNWALLYAAEQALLHDVPLTVVFCLRTQFKYATPRLLDFMFSGLAEVEAGLAQRGIAFQIVLGDPVITLPEFLEAQRACMLVSDFNPLRFAGAWKRAIVGKVQVPCYEVDAHNIIPAWEVSQKQEFAARTIRPKIYRLLPEFLTDYPDLPMIQRASGSVLPVNWSEVKEQIHTQAAVPPVTWVTPGEHAAAGAVSEFIKHRLSGYAKDRNDPNLDGQSGLSPYLHFGQLSAQRVVLDVLLHAGLHIQDVVDTQRNGAASENSVAAFVEELVVRRELSDNFCYYNQQYDSVTAFPDWAKKSLAVHAGDAREYVYTQAQLAAGETHDELWNAAQLQMVRTGKMHGYMRMYWAKKILEWTRNPEEAIEYAVHLNDLYSLDGRDPNGYAGIAWSIGGVHDRPWFDRAIFGQIRYMSAGGAKTKFDIKAYIARIGDLS